MSTNLSPPSEVYSAVNLITNVMRAINMGFSISIIIMCSIILNFAHRTAKIVKGAILPLISATGLLVGMISAVAMDFIKPACTGRSVGIYSIFYASQICLEIYQTNRIRMLAHSDVTARSIGYALFIIRASSLVVLLFYYYDWENNTNHVCTTGLSSLGVILEKAVLLVYNSGNLLILYHLSRTPPSQSHTQSLTMLNRASETKFPSSHPTSPGTQPAFRSLSAMFFYQDGLTFSLAILLDGAYVAAILTVRDPWMMSLVEGLANGFNLAILHIKYCFDIRVFLMALIKPPPQMRARNMSVNEIPQSRHTVLEFKAAQI
ncbi:hypothetical protein HDU97_004196 [Phlyctochytrium planicorne]|nr:hypothetical protein HDU97_004196 [Phlyctochytrium planicorne]